MTTFNWYKALGFGVIIWAVSLALTWGIAYFAITPTVGVMALAALIVGIVAYLLAMNTRPHTLVHASGYGAIWVAVGLALDLVIASGIVAVAFATWTYWLAYAFVLLAPIAYYELSDTRAQEPIFRASH